MHIAEKTCQFWQLPDHWHFWEMALLKGETHSIYSSMTLKLYFFLIINNPYFCVCGCFMDVSWVFKGIFTGVLRTFQMQFWVFMGVIGMILSKKSLVLFTTVIVATLDTPIIYSWKTFETPMKCSENIFETSMEHPSWIWIFIFHVTTLVADKKNYFFTAI